MRFGYFVVALAVLAMPLSCAVPTPMPSVRVIEPSSPISLWAESKVGPVGAQETHYIKPSPGGRYAYIYSTDSRNILVMNLDSNLIIQEIKMPGFWA